MKMIKNVEIQSVANFTQAVEEFKRDVGDQKIFLRGQTAERPLRPSLTRPGGPGLDQEKEIVEEFKRRMRSRQNEDLLDWDAVITGQHHGLPTRLLDWTEMPLAALYFAVEGDLKSDNGPKKPGVVIATSGSPVYTPDLKKRLGEARGSFWMLGLSSSVPIIRLTESAHRDLS